MQLYQVEYVRYPYGKRSLEVWAKSENGARNAVRWYTGNPDVPIISVELASEEVRAARSRMNGRI